MLQINFKIKKFTEIFKNKKILFYCFSYYLKDIKKKISFKYFYI